MGDDDIFDEDGDITEEVHQESSVSTKNEENIPKSSRKTQLIIGGGIFTGIGVLIFLALTGIIDVTESEPFDSAQCNFGVNSNFFGDRCISQKEYNELQEVKDVFDEKPTTVDQNPTGSSGGTEDVSSASDKVEVKKSNNPIGYYLVTSNDDWYGDYVDIRKIPSKIEKSGSMKVNFECFTDSFARTSTYFATFRNVIQNDLSVEVYINGLEVESKSTDKNKALILEGSCYGNES